MPSLRQQIRDYYAAHTLSPERADEILRAGRDAVSGEHAPKVIAFQRWPRVLALAAAVAMFIGLVFLVVPQRPAVVPFAALAPRVIDFFGGAPTLPKISQDKAALHEWLLAKGAPEFTIPAKLATLESYGCSVVDVQGQPAYLTCFWRKKNPDGSGGELIHLLAVRSDHFRDAPRGREPQTREIDGWSFASWAEGAVTYTLAAVAPLEQVRAFVAVAPSPVRVLAAVSF